MKKFLSFLIFILNLFVLNLGAVTAHAEDESLWYGVSHMGYGMMGFGMFFWIAFWVGVIWLIYYLITHGDHRKEADSIEILKKRYAEGEITEKEFKRKKKELE